MTERKSLLEQALDVCLYAPVGLAISVTEELPQLVDKGRARVNSQLAMAKMVGSFAVAQGQREAERVVRHATSRVSEGGPFGATPPAAREAGLTMQPVEEPGDLDAAPWATPAGGSEPTNGDGAGAASMVDDTARSDGVAAVIPSTRPAPEEDPSAPAPAPAMPAGDASALAIPGYDALSASQVAARLDDLSSAELRKVRDYERRHQARKSVIGAIEKRLAH